MKCNLLLLCTLIALIFLTVNVAATQLMAAMLDYDIALGQPIAGSLYHPLAWTWWFDQFAYQAPVVIWVGVGVFFSLVAFDGVSYLRHETLYRNPRPAGNAYGTARWADELEIETVGMFAPGGVRFGAWVGNKGEQRVLRHDGPEHIAVIAPTRAGKGIGVVVPTLLSWTNSAVVYDQKGELWALTSGWRAKNVGPVYRFAPADVANSFRFNPLGALRIGTPAEVGDTQNLVTIITDPDGKKASDHWTKSAQSLLTGVILFICYEKRRWHTTATLGDIVAALSDPDRPPEHLLRQMAENEFGHGGVPHHVIAQVGAEGAEKPDKEMGSILSHAISYLTLYRDPVIVESLSSSTISYEDIVNSDKPVTVYLVTREEDKDRLRPFVRLFLTQLLRVLLRKELDFRGGQGGHNHRLLLLIDEFVSLGKVDFIQESLSYIAGYGIRAMLVIQDIAQLQGVYGRDETIIANSHLRILYAPNRVETAEWISKALGKQTLVRTDITLSGPRTGRKSRSTKYAEQGRDLLLPDEVMRLRGLRTVGGHVDPGELVVLAAGQRPILGVQTPYFLDDELNARAAMEPPVDDVDTVGEAEVEARGKPGRQVLAFSKIVGNQIVPDQIVGEIEVETREKPAKPE